MCGFVVVFLHVVAAECIHRLWSEVDVCYYWDVGGGECFDLWYDVLVVFEFDGLVVVFFHEP